MAVDIKSMIKRGLELSTSVRQLVNNTPSLSSRCILCLAPAHPESLCQACEADLPKIRNACATCGLPLPFPALACGRCQKQPPAFDRVQTAFFYTFPVKPMIGRFKYQGELAMARPLIGMLAQKLYEEVAPWPDVILPCPIHSHRYRARGFNQAAVIAGTLGKRLQIPVDYRLCARTHATPPQTGLDRAARLQNLKNGFALTAPAPSRVAIVDDVITTGATTEQLARTLKAGGSQDISVWALARTPLL